MALVGLAIVGGLAYVGTKTINMRRQPKTYSFLLTPQDNRPKPFHLSDFYMNSKRVLQKFTLGEARRQHLQEFSSESQADEISVAERDLHGKMVIFTGSLGLASVGALVYAPVSLLSLPGALYILKDVYIGSVNALIKESRVNVDSLVSVLVTVLLFKGYFIICHIYIFLFLLNRNLLNKIKRESSKNIIDVFREQPRFAWVLVNDTEIEMAIEDIGMGDLVVVRAGGTVPVDGSIVSGLAAIDQHILTGESQPAEKSVGDHVFALTVVLTGWVHIQVDKVGQQTAAAHIGHVLNRTVNFKTGKQLWAERITDQTVLPTLALSAVAWPILGPTGALIVLNSHFRYRLTIITSTSVLNFLNLGAQQGILIKDGRIFEYLNQVDTIVFDKTGTLTQEQPYVGHIHTCGDWYETEVLTLAAAAEARQTHPIAQAILQAAQGRDLRLPDLEDASYKVGYGLTVSIDGRLVRVGSLRFADMEGLRIPPSIHQQQDDCHRQGHSLVVVGVDHQVVGAIELHATIRPEVKAVIEGLRKRNIRSMYIISGDHAAPTEALANELGIQSYFAEVLPERKADLIRRLQEGGRSVCYIGDGINDAIALKQAMVSVSIRGASTVATDTAQVVLMDESLSHLCDLFDLAREFEKNIKSTFQLILAPCLLNLGGALIPQFGLAASMCLSGASVVAGFTSAMLPLVRYQKQLTDKAGQTRSEQTAVISAAIETSDVISTSIETSNI